MPNRPCDKGQPMSRWIEHPTRVLTVRVLFVAVCGVVFLLAVGGLYRDTQCLRISGQLSEENAPVVATHSTSTTTSATPTTATTFLTALKTAYSSAIAKESISISNETRPTFDVNKWKETTQGGLSRKDRAFLGIIYGQATSVFEWGLGESTRIAAFVKVPRYSGIDSDSNYVSDSRSYGLKHFRFYFADIGETQMWGQPKETLPKSVYDYQFAPLASEFEAFDVYMVDGRFRIPCVAVAFLHASQYGHEATVLMHDYERKDYHVVEEIANVHGHSGEKLVALKLKSTTTDEDLLDFWKRHKDNTF